MKAPGTAPEAAFPVARLSSSWPSMADATSIHVGPLLHSSETRLVLSTELPSTRATWCVALPEATLVVRRRRICPYVNLQSNLVSKSRLQLCRALGPREL